MATADSSNATEAPGILTDISHKTRVVAGLSDLWQTKHFCDLVISTEDEDIDCHRAVISILAPGMMRLLDRASLDSNGKFIVCYDHVGSSLMKKVLNYLYTGELDVVNATCEKLVDLAHELGIEGLVKLCCGYMENIVDINNVVHLWKKSLVWGYMGLWRKAKKLILSSFVKSKELPYFYKDLMTFQNEDLHQLFQDDLLRVPTENDVLRFTVKWFKWNIAERTSTLYEVLRHVRLNFTSRDLIHRVLQDPDIQTCERSVMLLTLAEASWGTGYPPSELYSHVARYSYYCGPFLAFTNTPPAVRVVNPSGPVPEDLQERIQNVHWKDDSVKKSVCLMNGDIHVSGVGADGREVWRLDTRTQTWLQLPPLAFGRRLHAMVCVNDKLYVVGGFLASSPTMTTLSNVEVFESGLRHTWIKAPKGLVHRVRKFACVVYGRIIITLGGETVTQETDYVQMYDTSNSTCRANITKLPIPIADAQAAIWRDYIFVLSENIFLTYDMSLKKWERKNIALSILNFGCCVLNDTLYMAGGHTKSIRGLNGSKSIYAIKAQDAKNNARQWKKVGQIPFVACVQTYIAMSNPIEMLSLHRSESIEDNPENIVRVAEEQRVVPEPETPNVEVPPPSYDDLFPAINESLSIDRRISIVSETASDEDEDDNVNEHENAEIENEQNVLRERVEGSSSTSSIGAHSPFPLIDFTSDNPDQLTSESHSLSTGDCAASAENEDFSRQNASPIQFSFYL